MSSPVACVLVLVFGIIVSVQCKKLPRYISACSLSSENFEACAIKNGQNAIPHIIKGDEEYQIPSMSPLRLDQLNIQVGNNLEMNLTDVDLYGLETTVVKKFKYDNKNNSIDMTIGIKHISVIGSYNMKGQILILPVTGKGPCNLTYTDGVFNIHLDTPLVKRNNKQYISIAGAKVVHTVSRAYMHFDNLFNGNQLLGNELNRFLDENWLDVERDLAPAVEETIAAVTTKIASNIFSKVPVVYAFLP